LIVRFESNIIDAKLFSSYILSLVVDVSVAVVRFEKLSAISFHEYTVLASLTGYLFSEA